MDYLLATSPAVPLPKGLLSFNQCPANLAIPDLTKDRDRVSFSPQTIYSVGRLMADLFMGAFRFQWVNPQQPVLGLSPQGV